MPGLIPGAPEMLIGKITDIRALMAKYGDQDKPIIFSELGWSTYTGSGYLRPVDQVTQRNYLARAYMHAIAGDIKRMHWYDFQDDGLDATNLEHNLGLIDWNGIPKKSYYAYYTMVKVLKDAKFIRTTPNVQHPYYSYEYWHEDNNQYITSLWAADESTKTATFKTKDTGVTVVGIDGSYKYVPVSDGMASLTITGAPAFIYSSSGIEIMSIDDSFTLKDPSLDVRRGDVVTTSISRSGMGVELNGRLELVGPSEEWKLDGDANFSVGSTAIPISITVPLTAEEKTQDITLNVISGTSVVASLKLKVNVLETIKVRMAPEPVEAGQWDQWNVVLYMENATPDKILSGSLSVTNAVYMAVGQQGPISFSDLKPGEIKKITIPIIELPEKARAALKVMVTLDSGFTKVIDRPFNFIAAVSDRQTPVIDGDIEEGWHKGMPIVINRPDQNKNIANWGGEDDLSGRGYLKWDRNYMYMAMKVKDDIHVQKGVGGDIWQGDSIQFAIDTGRANGVGSSQNNEIGIALGEKGPIVWRWLSGNGKSEGEMTNVQAAVYRSNTYTSYELAIPWSELLPEGRLPASGDILGFSMLINENDATTRRGWLEYMSGIGSSKNTQLFEDMILSRVGLPDVSVEAVVLDQPTIALDKGASASLTAIVTPDDATNIKVNFTSSNPSVVSVTQATYGGATATVTGVQAGTATITVTTEDGHKTASSVVTVTEPIVVIPVTGVTLDRAELALNKGAAAFLTAMVNPDQASNKQVTFTSSDPEIVSVSQATYGLQATVTGIQYGTATITVKTEDGGYTATSTVTVVKPKSDEESSYGGSVPVPSPKPTVHEGTIELPVPVIKQDGTAVADVPMDSLEQAMRGAAKLEQRIVVIDIPDVQGATKITVILPASALAAAQSLDIERVEVRSGMATLSLAPDALREYNQTTSTKLEISIELIDPAKLTDPVAAKVGNKPVYDFQVHLDGKKIEQFYGKEAVKVSIDYTLAPGENADLIIAYHIRDNGTLKVIKNGTYDPATGKATFTVSHFSKYTVLYTYVTFQDLEDVAWAKGSIQVLTAREVIQGIGSGLFAPHKKVTRAEFIQMIINAFDLIDSNAKASFSDVQASDWYFQAVASAQKLGIVQGYEDGSFGVNQEITRQEMAVMAYRALTVAEKQLKKTVTPAQFADHEEIGAFAIEAVAVLQQAGVINGMDEQTFAPELNATRAQAATMIYRIQKGVVQ
ncbi:Endo-1,4-beta-xylanase A precursor [compost metagenome]